MMQMKRLKGLLFFVATLLTAVFITFTTYAYADPKIITLELEDVFQANQGTLVIKNLKSDKVYAYNPERSKERFTPESSFKVPNALIGLEVKVVADEYDIKRWDGVEREFQGWNRDHTLGSAMRHSAIWYYQELARDIGKETMEDYLNQIDYGNRDITGGIDTFWLNTSLKISAQEQAAFMEKLVEEDLPFQKKTMKTVKRIMIDDEQDEYIVHGKTGTRLSDMGLGWYVGYIETNKDTWVFATNVAGSGTKAKQLTMESLEKMKIINE
nr:class D beta-lactamase [Paenibacillus sp. V4I7]